MLAGLERARGPLGVQAVGQWDVHRVDRWVGQQRVVACVHAWDAVQIGEALRPRHVARGDCGDCDIR